MQLPTISKKELINSQKSEDLIFDVGMHKGEDTKFYLCKGYRVIGIEADPDLVELCSKRFAEEISTGQLKIIQGAIVKESQVNNQANVTFYKNLKYPSRGTINNQWKDRNTRSGYPSKAIKVRGISFKEILCEHGIPYYLKIDIEGADMICVEDLRHFTNKPSYLSIESDRTSIFSIIKELRTLNELGYNQFQAVQQSANHIINAITQTRNGNMISLSFESNSSGFFGAELKNKWKSLARIILHYGAIRIRYMIFGDDSLLFLLIGRHRRRFFNRLTAYITPVKFPGWYDTHARHNSASKENSFD
jgi:FkbM family methyltransferase